MKTFLKACAFSRSRTAGTKNRRIWVYYALGKAGVDVSNIPESIFWTKPKPTVKLPLYE